MTNNNAANHEKTINKTESDSAPTFSSLTANPTSIPADGRTQSDVGVVVMKNGQPAGGYLVQWHIEGPQGGHLATDESMSFPDGRAINAFVATEPNANYKVCAKLAGANWSGSAGVSTAPGELNPAADRATEENTPPVYIRGLTISPLKIEVGDTSYLRVFVWKTGVSQPAIGEAIEWSIVSGPGTMLDAQTVTGNDGSAMANLRGNAPGEVTFSVRVVSTGETATGVVKVASVMCTKN